MYPVQKQEGTRGIGMGYMEFVEGFEALCQEHLRDRRARAFAFVFYNMENGIVRQALSQAHGFRLLHEKTGKDITLFYLHDSAVDEHCHKFNNNFMAALGVEEQAVPPCMVFFGVHGDQIEDVSIYVIDEQTQDPILVVAELEQYIDEATTKMNAQGNLAGISDWAKTIARITAVAKFSELILKLKGAV